MPARQARGITLSAQIFVLLALAAPIVWCRDHSALVALTVIAIVWLAGHLTGRATSRRTQVILVEAAVVGAICGIVVESAPALLLCLALPPFLAAIHAGLPGVRLALCAEVIAVVLPPLISTQRITAEQGLTIFTWGMAGLGLGLIGSFVHVMAGSRPTSWRPTWTPSASSADSWISRVTSATAST